MMERVDELESLLNVEKRWEVDDAKYKAIVVYTKERAYWLNLDHMEKLVVQRLFEMQKTNTVNTCMVFISHTVLDSGTNMSYLKGYRIRTSVTKHLTSRVVTVKASITKFNRSAQALDPPRPTLTAAEVLNKTFVAEFNMLREARTDIRTKPWADPTFVSLSTSTSALFMPRKNWSASTWRFGACGHGFGMMNRILGKLSPKSRKTSPLLRRKSGGVSASRSKSTIASGTSSTRSKASVATQASVVVALVGTRPPTLTRTRSETGNPILRSL